jgi:hypothetical protein
VKKLQRHMEPVKFILPDALDDTRFVIIKACGSLRLTHEIRLAVALARESHREFVLAVDPACILSTDLSRFLSDSAATVIRTPQS